MRRSRSLLPGTYVKFRSNLLRYVNPVGIVVEHNTKSGAVYLQTEGSDRACVARHEISPMSKPPQRLLRHLRHLLPYGKWTCEDGREILFNRDYKPIWQRQGGGQLQAADRNERITFIRKQDWFYDDSNQPWRNNNAAAACNKILQEWGAPPIC